MALPVRAHDPPHPAEGPRVRAVLQGRRVEDAVTLLISRKTWGSTYPYGTRHNAKPADPHKVETCLHTTVTVAPDLTPPYDDEYAAMRTLERIGVDRFGSGVSYNAVIMPTGRAYAGMPLDTKATHSEFERWNWDRASIALCGDYSKHKPSVAMIATVVALQVEWRKAGIIGTVTLRGHYEVAAKACPGRYAIVKMDGIAVAARRQLAIPEPLKPKPAPAPKPKEPAVAWPDTVSIPNTEPYKAVRSLDDRDEIPTEDILRRLYVWLDYLRRRV